MSKKILFAAALIIAAASCNKSNDKAPEVYGGGFEEGTATFTVNVMGLSTKATSTNLSHLDNEKKLESNFQIVAYEKDSYNMPLGVSTWYNVETVGSQTSFTPTMTPGKKRLLFLCNQTQLKPSVVPTWSDRAKAVTDTRDAFTASHLPLGLGYESSYNLEVSAGASINSDIALTHMCSRIALKSIIDETNDDRIVSLKGKSISLLNVPVGLKMNGTIDESSLYNPDSGDYSTAEKCAATTALGAGPRSFFALTYTNETLDPGYLYTYPGTQVRLLVGLDIKLTGDSAAKTYYYSIPISGLAFNKTYDVVLRVRNLGSLDPTKPAIPTLASFSVSVADWVAANEIDEMM